MAPKNGALFPHPNHTFQFGQDLTNQHLEIWVTILRIPNPIESKPEFLQGGAPTTIDGWNPKANHRLDGAKGSTTYKYLNWCRISSCTTVVTNGVINPNRWPIINGSLGLPCRELTYHIPTRREKDNHRLKSAGWASGMWSFPGGLWPLYGKL